MLVSTWCGARGFVERLEVRDRAEVAVLPVYPPWSAVFRDTPGERRTLAHGLRALRLHGDPRLLRRRVDLVALTWAPAGNNNLAFGLGDPPLCCQNVLESVNACSLYFKAFKIFRMCQCMAFEGSV